MITSVTVVGAGGAFDTTITNSSFLINTDKGSILYDCGYNVFPKLVEMDENSEDEIIGDINTIIVSHDDDDHMGSVKSLLYYMYFILGKKDVNLYCPDHMVDMFSSMNKEMKSSRYFDAQIVEPRPIHMIKFEEEERFGAEFRVVRGIHHTTAYGVIAHDKRGNIVAISGDTKANVYFEEEIKYVANRMNVPNVEMSDILIFHDYSFWDAPSRQVHACKSDVDVEYSNEFLSQAIMYHNAKATCAGKTFSIPLKNKEIEHERKLYEG